MDTSAAAQGRPFGIPPPADVRATLGDCPVEALRDAWDGMDALEAVAVEAEVLRLCTERADAITRLLERQTDLDAAVAALRAPASVPAQPEAEGPSLTVSDPALEALRGEVATLRRRIEDLEGRNGGSAALPALREALARKERQLGEAVTAAASVPPVAADPGEDAAAGDPATASPSDGAARPVPTVPAATTPERAVTPVPPAPEVSDWNMDWTARTGDGPWTAALSRTVTVCDWVMPPDPAAPGAFPHPDCSERREGPFMVAAGGCLPDGAFVTGLGPDGPDLTDPDDPACDGVTGPGTAPPAAGWLAFDVHPVGPEP